MTAMVSTAFEKLKFLGRQGLREYKRSGRRFFRDLRTYLSEARHLGRDVGTVRVDARVEDWDANHPLRKSVLEASFTAEMVRQRKPTIVYDVGSDLVFLVTLSSFVKVIGVDTRAIELKKPGLTFKKSDACRLPFGDGECDFMTSLCVIEHIGLGRYGDSIDPLGDFKFIDEMRRCLRPGGVWVLSMPVAGNPALIFNAHRLYSLAQIQELTTGLSVMDEGFIKPGCGLLSRDEALNLLTHGSEEYMVWIGCLEKSG